MASGDGAALGTGGVGTHPAASSSSAAAPNKIRKKVTRRSGHEYNDPGVQAFAATTAAQLDPAAAAAQQEPKKELPESIPVTCCGEEAFYLPDVQKMLCQCKSCKETSRILSPNEWENHTGSKKKNWKLCVKVKGTDQLLDHLLQKFKSSTASEGHQTSTAEMLKNKSYTADCPGPKRMSSPTLKNKSKKELPESILVTCCGKEAFYLPDVQKMLCQCKSCKQTSRILSPNEWENHTGSKKKNWKLCVKVKGTDQLLDHLLVEFKSSTTTESHQACAAEMLKKESYTADCPGPKRMSSPTLKNKSKKEFPESIPVTCCGKEAFYLPDVQKMLCQCKSCKQTSRILSPNEWENHTGSKKKNWKLCVKVKGTDQLLDHLLQKFKSSTASEGHQTSTAEMLKNKLQKFKSSTASEGHQTSTAEMLKNKAEKPKVCILEDNDVMSLHKSRSKKEHENPFRVLKIMDQLDEDGVLDRVAREPFDRAKRDLVLLVHGEAYLPFVDSLPMTVKEQKARFPLFAGRSLFSSAGTPEAVYKAAGAVLRGAELVVEGYFEKAFAIIRPPGHHADKSKAEGFCYLNNMAIGAQHLLTNYAKKRILLVDFDVHHGNGTQEIFYDTNQVLFFSTHRNDLFYPLSDMSEDCTGKGVGKGYNVNVPLEGSFGDKEFFYIWKYLLLPLATAYSPEIVFISAGYDAGVEDPLGGCHVSPKCFGTIVHQLLRFGGGKMVLGLEGGYHLTQLPIAVSYTIRALLGDSEAFIPDGDIPDSLPNDSAIKAVANVKRELRPYWPGVFE